MPDMPIELDSTDMDAAERINDALDAISLGESPAFHLHRLDDETARTIDQFHKLDSHSGAPTPAEAFVNQLREDLMMTPHSALPDGGITPRASTNKSMHRFIRAENPTMSADTRVLRRPWWGAFEAAAAVLLVIALVGTLLSGQRQLPPTSAPNQYALAPQPSPSAMLAAVSTPEASPVSGAIGVVPTDVVCDAAADTFATPDLTGDPTTETLLPWPTSGERPAIQGWGALLPEEVPVNLGSPADPDTITSITAATGELRACINAGDVQNTQALLSGDYLRRLEQLGPSEGGRINQESPRSFVPLAANSETIPGIRVSDVRRLPDGRVVASLTPDNVADSGVLQYFLYIFVRVGDRWLVDEAIPVADYPSTEITITDTGFNPKNIIITPQKSKMMNFIVRNDGTITHSFTSTDLNVSVEVAPGDVQRVPVQLRPGNFSFFSIVPGDVGAGLTGRIIIPAQTGPSGSNSTLQIVGDAPVNLMSVPTSAGDGEVLAAIPVGTTVVLLSTSATLQGNDPNGELWLYVLYGDSLVGWVREADTNEVPTATSTSTAVASDQALNPRSSTLRIHVYVDGVLTGDLAAIATARTELDRVLAPFVDGSNCQIGFVLITSRAFDLDQGVRLSDAIAQMIQTDYPQLLISPTSGVSSLASESIGIPDTTRVGDVELQLFFNRACQPAPFTPAASAVAP